MIVLECITFTGQAADRWKWYYSSDHYGFYYDTQTVTYDPATQCAMVWKKVLKEDGSIYSEIHIVLDYEHKSMATFEIVKYRNGYAQRKTPSKLVILFVPPDSLSETLSRMVAEQEGINPMYPGGTNRWKWIHATDQYSMYVAKDTLHYGGQRAGYIIWAKRVYLDGSVSKKIFFCDLDKKLIRTDFSNWEYPLPDSDEEAVLNAVKELNAGA